jgi:GTPase Era involved in 16S rRNA processing
MIKGVQQSKLYTKPDGLIKLTKELSDSERLLLIGFGYEIAIADGSIDPKERQYLQMIGDRLHLSDQLLSVLEESLTRQSVSHPPTVTEIRYLLDPARFQSLDPIFAHAAAQILKQIPQSDHSDDVSAPDQLKYEALIQQQAQNCQIEEFCKQLAELLSQMPPKTFDRALEDVNQLAERVRSQRFRVAIVGEFSQGKSTLLNALLGEEIQPVQVTPCSGAITVFRYGNQKRVTCRDRDGTETEIPIKDYQEKAKISEGAALNHRNDALAHSTIDEIIFEHPKLELCRAGVEIIDSPGLNEHPERTRITQKLLKDADAVIFLTSATRTLTESERKLLQDLKAQLNKSSEQPADNLFVLVNFMDLLRKEQDRQQVQQRVENFVYGESPLIASKNRLYFISAQIALEAVLTGQKNEYVEMLQQFVSGLEQFLTAEKGETKNRQSINQLAQTVQQAIEELTQTQRMIEGEITVSIAARQSILEQLGESSGRFAKLQEQIQCSRDEKLPEVLQISKSSLKKDFEEQITKKSRSWHSTQEEKSKIVKEFAEKFQADSHAIVKDWVQKIIVEATLSTALKAIDLSISEMVQHFRKSVTSIDQETGSQLVHQLDLSIERVAPEFKFNSSTNPDDDFFETLWNTGIGGGIGLGAGGVFAGGVAFAVTSIAFFPVVLSGAAIAGIAAGGAALGTAIGGTLGFFAPPDQDAIRKEILNKGFKQLIDQNLERQWIDAIETLTNDLFEQKFKAAQEVTNQYITLLNSLLEDSASSYKLTVKEAETKRQQRINSLSELETFRSQINSFPQKDS